MMMLDDAPIGRPQGGGVWRAISRRPKLEFLQKKFCSTLDCGHCSAGPLGCSIAGSKSSPLRLLKSSTSSAECQNHVVPAGYDTT
jgi:hypothetical protein